MTLASSTNLRSRRLYSIISTVLTLQISLSFSFQSPTPLPPIPLPIIKNRGSSPVRLLLSAVSRDPIQPRTLYDILQVAPTASRDELKKQYLRLAKVLHPDASRNRQNNNNNNNNNAITWIDGSSPPEFSEVAAAWRILSDPRERKKYDRSLKAQKVVDDVERAANEFGKEAGPRMKMVFDQLVNPVFRRTTASTAAAMSAAARDLRERRVGNVIDSVIRAGRDAVRAVDSIELLEKSLELRERARGEIRKAKDVKGELLQIRDRRVRLSLATPNSKAISSTEAIGYLNTLNITTSDSLREFQKTVKQIKILEDFEYEYDTRADNHDRAKQELETKKNALKKAAKAVEDAIQEEERAAEALFRAQQRVKASKIKATELLEDLSSYEPIHRQKASDLDEQKKQLDRQLEIVRQSLKRNEKTNKNSILPTPFFPNREQEQQPTKKTTTNDEFETTDAAADEVAMKEITTLVDRERRLISEITRLKERAANMRVNSKKLKTRSDEIKNENGNQQQQLRP